MNRAKKASTEQLVRIAAHVAIAPFAGELLTVDQRLWGSFWQGDVIAPGTRLPAVELALLRAVRLDGDWPESATVPQFLADLRRTILNQQTGIWTLPVVGQPCLVFASSETTAPPQTINRTSKFKNPKSITVVWYCASTGRLHAGYRTTPREFRLKGATAQRGLEATTILKPTRTKEKQLPGWPAQTVNQGEGDDPPSSLAARLDLEILRIRVGTG